MYQNVTSTQVTNRNDGSVRFNILNGVTRKVILVGRFAIKIPRIAYGWKLFLQGLLANIQEATFSKASLVELCPVLFSSSSGLFLVMRRATSLTEEEWKNFDPKNFCIRKEYVVPAEYKIDSFGKLDGRIVAVDYGN